MSGQLDLLDHARSERERVLDALSRSGSAYIETLRSLARVHALRHGTVTIDDVRDAVAREGYPMPSELGKDARVFGVVFRSREFVAVEQVLSRREEAVVRSGRARAQVTVYRLVEAQP